MLTRITCLGTKTIQKDRGLNSLYQIATLNNLKMSRIEI